jgi:hypothetical protein
MVSYCLACSEPFVRLNRGKIFALEVRPADVEFFWLCAACCNQCAIVMRDGSPLIIPLDGRTRRPEAR